jgi:hypothetical protein
MYPTIEQTDSQDLCRRIIGFLTKRGVQSIERLQLTSDGGVLTVGGSLPSDSDQRLCLECCRRTAGVVRVVDQTHVYSVRRKRRRPTLPAPARREVRMRLSR